MISQQVLDWLLADPESALRWRTLTEFLDRTADDLQVLAARSARTLSVTWRARRALQCHD